MSPSDFFTSGRAVDLVLIFMVLEFGFLYWRRRTRMAGAAAVDLIFALAPGACLLLALRAALTAGGWIWVAVLLAASLPLHLADLARRRL